MSGKTIMQHFMTLATALLAGVASAQAPTGDVDPRALTLSDVLLEKSRSMTEDQLDERLRGLGSGFVAPMFEAIATSRLVVLDEFEEPRYVPLETPHEVRLLHTLTELPHESVRGHLHRVGFGSPDPSEKNLVLRLLQHVGVGDDVPLLLEVSEPPAGKRRPDRMTSEWFQLALRGILEREPAVPHAIEERFAELHPGLVAPIVRTVSGLRSRAALECLTNLLGVVEEADGLLLLEVGRLAGQVPPPFHRTTRDAVRRNLHKGDVETLLRTADVIGKLEDREALPLLIGLLDHRVAGVGKEANEALKLMTRQDLGADRQRWEEWYGKTMRWWHEDAPKMLDDLRHGKPGDASAALLELSRQRVFRHDLVEPVTAVLGRKEHELVLLACAVLGHLGSWKAIPVLVERLDDPDPKVQAEAMRALQRITGKMHRDVGPWKELARALS